MSQVRIMKADEIVNFKEKRDQIEFYTNKLKGLKLNIDKLVNQYNEHEKELVIIKELPYEKPEPVAPPIPEKKEKEEMKEEEQTAAEIQAQVLKEIEVLKKKLESIELE